MHTTNYLAQNEFETNVTFHHNGDYSGEVIVFLDAKYADVEVHNNGVEVRVPFAAMEKLVAQKVSGEFVSKFENVTSMDELFDALMMPRLPLTDIVRFVRELAALDDDTSEARATRRSVTLQDIIERAKEALEP